MRRLAAVLSALLALAAPAAAGRPASSAARARARADPSAHAAARLPGALTEEEAPVRVTFLDVGQGDAVLLQAPGDRAVLVDAGRNPQGPGDSGPDLPLPARLRALGVDTVDLLVASHAHADHIGGMLGVLRSLPVRAYMDNGIPYTTRTYLTLMRALRSRPDVRYLRPTARTIRLGDAELRVLPPPAGVEDQNDGSVGLVLTYGSFRAFLSGDSERDELAWWLARREVPRVTLLKAPHHGSDNGFTPAFLAAARPDVVVISVGRNDYGHPMPEAVAAYASVARAVYRTDRDGDVTVRGWKDGRYAVRTGRAGRAGRGTAPARKRATAPGLREERR